VRGDCLNEFAISDLARLWLAYLPLAISGGASWLA